MTTTAAAAPAGNPKGGAAQAVKVEAVKAARAASSRMGERRRLNVVDERFHPAYVVWELTLRCDHACTHCGSRAAVARDNELTVDEALGVVQQLAEMGARE